MKDGIHPVMHAKAKTTCTTCQTVFLIPSTIEEQTVETCRMCHPIYTGKKQTDRRGGRIDRFKKRAEAAAPKKAA
jgi:ribosomal protein L31